MQVSFFKVDRLSFDYSSHPASFRSQNANNKMHRTVERKPSADETITILTRKGSKISATSTMDRTFLATGFGLRNVDSLERALREEERIKQRELERKRKLLLEQQRAQEEEYAGSDRFSDMMVRKLVSLRLLFVSILF